MRKGYNKILKKNSETLCLVCKKKLKGNQKLFCSKEHNQAYFREKYKNQRLRRRKIALILSNPIKYLKGGSKS